MSYLALARKWRPKIFAELVGQEHVVKALRNALDSGRVHHAFLFTGTRGVGKTTIARIFAKSLNCETGVSSEPCGQCGVCLDVDAGRFVDLIEIDAASRTKVDDTRELLENVVYAPSRGRYKVFLIDEVHMLSNSSFNALLKTLEEPPEHVKFLLATTDPQKMPVTVLSRCLQFNLRRLRSEEIAAQMKHILAAEGIEAEAGALALLSEAADGSLRDGLSLLDQAIAHGGGRVVEGEVRAMLGTIDQDVVLRLLEALADGDGGALFAAIEAAAAYVVDYGGVLDALSAALHRLQLRQLLPDAARDDTLDPARMAALAQRIAPEDVQLHYQIATQGRRELPMAPSPRIGFEMCLLRMLAFRPEAPEAERTPAPARPAEAPAVRSAATPARSATPVATAPAAAAVAHAAPAASSPPPGVAEAPAAPSAMLPLPVDTSTWIAAIEHLNLRGPVKLLADNCTVIGSDGSLLRLGLRSEHELLATDASRRQIEDGLQRATGQPVRLRFEPIADIADTPAARAAQARQARQADAETRFVADPAVRGALAALDGTTVPGSVRPIG